jgi:serpin B
MNTIPVLISVLLGCSSGGPAADSGDPAPSTCTIEGREVTDGALAAAGANNAFAFDLYGRLAGGEGNLLFSPYSMTAALNMTYAGAAGQTAAELAAVLRVADSADWHAGVGELLATTDDLAGYCEVDLATANRLFGQQDYPWLESFLAVTAEDYLAPLEEVDFISDPEGVRQEINEWVAGQTNERIQDLLPAGVLTADTRMVLTNAVAFEASWRAQFDPGETRDGEFRLAGGGSVTAPMMHRTGGFKLGWSDGVSAAALEYDGGAQSMILLLPDEADGLGALEASLDSALLDDLLAGLGEDDEAEIYLPRFTLSEDVPLKDLLIEMGMPTAFEMGAADFSNMADVQSTGEPLYIQDALHKAFIDVNEEGTEAAAATAVVVGTESAPPTFYADHPFAFLIRDNDTGAILFMGRVVDPS